MCDLHHRGCTKSNNANKFTLQCYGRTLYSKLHTFANKDRRLYVNRLKLGPSLFAENKQTSRPPSKGARSNLPLRGWISLSNPHPWPTLPPPPPPTGFTLIGVLRMQPYKFKVKYELGPKNIADPLSRLMGNQKISSSHSSEAEEYIRFVAVNATPVL